MSKQNTPAQPVYQSEFTAGRRTYTIGVHLAKSDQPYLRLIEVTHRKNDDPRTSHLLVFPQAIPAFKRALDEALARFAEAPTPVSPTTDPEPLRNAGESWTAQADEELLELYENKWTVPQLANRYSRSRGAIKSRLNHLAEEGE